MKNNLVYILEDRGVLYINGKDAHLFLQNIISNDINKVTKEHSCFASILTPQGKYLYEFIIVKHKNGYFLECEKKIADELFNKLKIYKLKSQVEILNLSNEFVVSVINKETFLDLENAKNIPGNTVKYREDPVYLDPRHSDLGGRIIINLEKLHLSLKKLNLKSSDISNYYKLSFDIGIPQTNTDKLQNNAFGIECNLEELNGIDFKKGCYIGQENTARIKLKDKLSKRLFPIRIINGIIQDDKIIKYNDKEVGKILINDTYPFALIKFRDQNFDFNKNFKCGSAEIKVNKPSWLDKKLF